MLIRSTAKDLQLSYQSVRSILKDDLQMKPYKMWRWQELTDQHRDQRMKFCNWFMEEDIDPQLVVFSDEKFFLHEFCTKSSELLSLGCQ